MSDDIVLLKDIPSTLTESVAHDLVAYTVGFIRVEGPNVDLLGSGVLVSAGAKRAIMTAHHVIDVLPKTGRLCIMLERTREPHTIDTSGLAFVHIAKGKRESEGPDLGAVVLAPSIAAAIGAKKSFFALDAKRDQMLSNPLEWCDGMWCAQGFLEERAVVTPDPDGRGRTTGFYNFTGVGGPEATIERDGHDYFEFPVAYEARPTAPVSWGGMSGGGLWQVPFKRQGDSYVHLRPLLSGILFYQWPTTESKCGVRAHGRQSVYRMAYNAIIGK